MDKEDRVIYETLYQLIIDLKNRDIEVQIESLMDGACLMFKDFWLCKLISG